MKAVEELGISPAPWRIQRTTMAFYWITDAGNNPVASTVCDNSGTDADARLIAAAPELYEACRELIDALKNRLPAIASLTEVEIINKARAALAKAVGAQ